MIARQVEIHPEALAEAAAAVAWYGKRSARAPAAFIEENENAVESILEAPNRWPIYELDCRRLPLLRFPYFIIYREKSDSLVQIGAVAHGRRRPGYWHTRS
jgi:toxin ParE1/3/4